MLLFATMQVALPYECDLVPITMENRELWIEYTQTECRKFETFLRGTSDPSKLGMPEGVRTLKGCLQLEISGFLTYVSCLVKSMPVGVKGPKELVMTMGAFTQEGCPIAMHMGISRTYSAFFERRKALEAPDLMPPSIFMHVLTARKMHALHPELVYTCSLPLSNMLEIFHRYLGNVVTVGYQGLMNDISQLTPMVQSQYARQPTEKHQQHCQQIRWIEAALKEYNTPVKDPVLSVIFQDVNGKTTEAPQSIQFKRSDGTWMHFNKSQFPWLFEKPFYPSHGVFGFLYVTMLTEMLSAVKLEQRILVVKKYS